jgi:hypothetical protein
MAALEKLLPSVAGKTQISKTLTRLPGYFPKADVHFINANFSKRPAAVIYVASLLSTSRKVCGNMHS